MKMAGLLFFLIRFEFIWRLFYHLLQLPALSLVVVNWTVICNFRRISSVKAVISTETITHVHDVDVVAFVGTYGLEKFDVSVD